MLAISLHRCVGHDGTVAHGHVASRRARVEFLIRHAREGEPGITIPEASGGVLRRRRDDGAFVVESTDGHTLGSVLSRRLLWDYFQETLGMFSRRPERAAIAV